MPRSTGHGVVALVAARYELVREVRVGADTVDWEAFDAALERPVLVQLLRPELADDAAAVERFWLTARAAARGTAAAGERVLDGGRDPETGRLFVVRERPGAISAAPTAAQVTRRVPALDPARVPRRSNDRPGWLVVSGVVVVLTLVALGIRAGVDGWLAWVNSPLARTAQGLGLSPAVAVPASGAQPGQSTPTRAAAPATVAPAARTPPPGPTAAASAPTKSATAAALTSGQTRRIVNTDGRGVALRATPGGDRLPAKGYDEGAVVQAFEQSGEWTRIRGSDGREGWVLTVTLAP